MQLSVDSFEEVRWTYTIAVIIRSVKPIVTDVSKHFHTVRKESAKFPTLLTQICLEPIP